MKLSPGLILSTGVVLGAVGHAWIDARSDAKDELMHEVVQFHLTKEGMDRLGQDAWLAIVKEAAAEASADWRSLKYEDDPRAAWDECIGAPEFDEYRLKLDERLELILDVSLE